MPSPVPNERPSRNPWLAVIVAAGLSLAISLPLIFSGRVPLRVAFDVVVYHEPAARYFAADWPQFDLTDYLSATTPGYHLLLAGIIRTVSESRTVLQLASAVIAAALAGVVGLTCGLRLPWKHAAGLTALVVLCPYVVQSGAWTLPDDLGWLGVAAILALAFGQQRPAARIIASGLVLALLVLVRQAHLWAAAAVFASAWLVATPPGGLIRTVLFRWPKRLPWAFLALACITPAVLVLAYFYSLWHGLTPPRFAAQHQGLNFATPAFVLANLGIVSVFFSPLLARAALATWREGRGWLIVALLLGLIAARAPDTTYSLDAGRYSGLWNLAKIGPVEGQTSMIILGLAVLGSLAAVVWVRALPQRHGAVFLATLIAFTAAQTANHHCWQRYVEPLVLILTVLAAASIAGTTGWSRPFTWGAAGLAALLLVSNVLFLRPFPVMDAYLEAYGREGVPPEGGFYVPKSGKVPNHLPPSPTGHQPP